MDAQRKVETCRPEPEKATKRVVGGFLHRSRALLPLGHLHLPMTLVPRRPRAILALALLLNACGSTVTIRTDSPSRALASALDAPSSLPGIPPLTRDPASQLAALATAADDDPTALEVRRPLRPPRWRPSPKTRSGGRHRLLHQRHRTLPPRRRDPRQLSPAGAGGISPIEPPRHHQRRPPPTHHARRQAAGPASDHRHAARPPDDRRRQRLHGRSHPARLRPTPARGSHPPHRLHLPSCDPRLRSPPRRHPQQSR